MIDHSNITPLVSVVIPAFNAAAVVREAVYSVQAQTFEDWELLLVDDGDTDSGDQAAVLADISLDSRIHVLATQGGIGAGPARNIGMDAAQGRFIAFLDADDIWHPKKLSMQLDAMSTQSAPLSCTGLIRLNVMTGKRTLVGVPEEITQKALLHTNVIACSSAIFDRDHYGHRHMPTLRRRQDFAFWLSLMADGSKAIGLSEPLLTYRQMLTSLSSDKHAAAKDTWTMYRNHLGLPLGQAGYYFAHYALRGAARQFAPSVARRLGWIHPVTELPP